MFIYVFSIKFYHLSFTFSVRIMPEGDGNLQPVPVDQTEGDREDRPTDHDRQGDRSVDLLGEGLGGHCGIN